MLFECGATLLQGVQWPLGFKFPCDSRESHRLEWDFGEMEPARTCPFSGVIPAKAGIQYSAALPGLLDPRFRGDDAQGRLIQKNEIRFSSPKVPTPFSRYCLATGSGFGLSASELR